MGVTLKVMTGDVVNLYGKSFWHNNTGANLNNTTYLINTAINSFIAAFAGTPTVAAASEGTASALEGASTTSTGVYNWVTTGVPTTPATVPRAYVNWILFNEQFVPVASNCGYDMVSSTADNIKSHSDALSIGTSGYLYVYCSNESNVDVYFDNLQVIQSRGPLLETNNYYGFGLAMAGISDKAVKTNYVLNKFRYHGKELQNQEFANGTGLEEYDYGARMQDPQIGRWTSADPKSEKYFSSSPYNFVDNNPVSRLDPTGQDWYFYQGQKEKGKTSHYADHHGKLKYKGVDGKSHSTKGFEYLAKFVVGTSSNGEKLGSVVLYKQDKVVATGKVAFSGGVGTHKGIEAGNYYMDLGQRKVTNPVNVVNTPHDGDEPKQSSRFEVFPSTGKMIYQGKLYDNNKPVTDAYGNARIRLEPAADLGNNIDSRGLYLHGKHADIYNTHGCLCDKSEAIQNYFLATGKAYKGLVPLNVTQ
jgi:RHS repeat-associated protein